MPSNVIDSSNQASGSINTRTTTVNTSGETSLAIKEEKSDEDLVSKQLNFINLSFLCYTKK